VSFSGALRARDPHSAARSAALILAVCAACVAGLTLFQPMGASAAAASWSGVALLVGAAVVCRTASPDRLDRVGAGVVIAVAGVVLTCCLNLLTRDSSAAAQAFLAFPVLWAASHLRPGAGVLVTGAAVAADGVILFRLLPAEAAIVDVVFFGAVLVVMALMLLRANATQERLVLALQEQLTVDSLTGLATRRAFDGALETALSRSVPGGTAFDRPRWRSAGAAE